MLFKSKCFHYNNESSNKIIPYFAKSFININFLNDTTNPHWLNEQNIKKSNLIFGSKIIIQPVFVAQTIHKYNPSNIPQIAIFGKSNVGKSSLINALLNYREVTQTSKKPGKTRHLFIFNLKDYLSIVDLPGYGFAKVSKILRDNWSILFEEYLNKATNLKRVLFLIDCEQLFNTYDFILLDMLIIKRIPFQIIITKIDKLKAHELHNLMIKILSILNNYKKKVDAYNEKIKKNKNILNKELYEFNINEYLHNVSSLKYYGIKELKANLSLIVSDHLQKKKIKNE